jgi:1,6-anhydro-N-acetylmuramate kinase
MLAIDGDESKLVIALGAAAVAIVWIIATAIRHTMSRRYREESRREVAAYVAEGTITPVDAVALLNAGEDEVRKTIADGVAWGTIKPQDAQALIGAPGRPAEPKPAA